jgi:hypothetical protein
MLSFLCNLKSELILSTDYRDQITCSKHGTECSIHRILDGHYRTHDHEKIWQCDLVSGNPDILIKFATPISIALVRFWNHNKSRIYSYRGVRQVTIDLDDKCIFDGEINRACGELQASLENLGDVSHLSVYYQKTISSSLINRDHF